MAAHETIRVVRRDGRSYVEVDGQPFPYFITRAEPITAPVHPDEIPTITLTLQARRVEVVNDLDKDTAP